MDFVIDLLLVEISSSSGAMKYNAIFTMVDRLTNFFRLVPCYFGDSRMSTQETARLFFDNFVRLFGVPVNVVNDHDPRFTAAFQKDLWQILGIKVLASSLHCPQTDGQTERAHRTMEQIIRGHVVEANYDKVWVTTLPFVEYAMNSSKNDTTNTTFFELVFGCLPSSPVDRIVGISDGFDSQQFVGDMATAVETTKSQIARAQVWQKRFFNARHTHVDITTDKRELLSTKYQPIGGTRLFRLRFIGPFNVVAKISDVSFNQTYPRLTLSILWFI